MPAIGGHGTATSDAAWDGPGNVARLRSGESRGYYARMYAWRDPDGDDTTKAAYKFPHHEVSGDGDPGAANVRGCQAGIAVLNGGRGGADIPDGDRRGVWNHLARHLRDADVEPADLRSGGGAGLWSSASDSQVPGATGRSPVPGGEDVERRTVTVPELRVEDGEDGPRRIVGYGAVFDEWSEDLGPFKERIRRGAFAKTIQEGDIRSLFNHDANYVIGRTKAGTLSLAEDEHGLRLAAVPPDTQWARDLLVSIERGDVNQMSFGFEVVRDEWANLEDHLERTLVEVRLFDVGPVTFPAYPQTSAVVRARIHELETSAPGQGAHPEGEDDADEQRRARLGRMRRELELAERGFPLARE